MYDWYSLLDKHLLYPAYYWRAKDPKLKHLKALDERQYWSIDKLQQWQLAKIQSMVKHAYDTVPFYKTLYTDAGICPEDIQTLGDIQALPCVRKKDIQEQGDQMLSSAYVKSDLVADASGGSTGMPTHFYKDKAQYQLRAADQIRHDRWSGWDIGDPYALIWGAQKDLKAMSSLKQRIVTQFIHRVIPMDAFDLTVERMHDYTHTLEKNQPPMILGYAGALATFAKFLVENKPEHSIRPKAIISSAEALSDDNRKLIEDVFQTKVLNRYGSREVGLIASECQLQTGLHINADNVYVEVGDFTDQPGFAAIPKLCQPDKSGEIIVTDFWNYGMPFIRYRMGDEGSLINTSCGCNRTLPLMGQISGRVSDFITAMDGTRIHGEYFTHLFYDLADVTQFQLIQEELALINVKVVADKVEFTGKAGLIAAIKKVCGQDVVVNIILSDQIAPSPSGKFLFTISKI